MIIFWTLLSCLISFQLVTSEKVEDTALAFGQILQLECLQRNEDGEVRFTVLSFADVCIDGGRREKTAAIYSILDLQ
jgi:hypothetical protein